MKPCLFLAILALLLLSGCRREDVREFAMESPSFTERNRSKVADALRKYQGIKWWNMENKTLTIRYDSMQVARTNLRMALAAKGLAITFPTNTTGRAGY